MIRGNFVFIGEDRSWYVSQEYNGGMNIEQKGKEILDRFKEGFKSPDEFRAYITKFNEAHFKYEDGSNLFQILQENMKEAGEKCTKGFQCHTCPKKDCGIFYDYMGSSDFFNVTTHYYHSDYMYVYNGSGEPIEMAAENAVIEIAAGGYAVFHYVEFMPEHSSGCTELEQSEVYADILQGRNLMDEFGCTEEEVAELAEQGCANKVVGVTDDAESLAEEYLSNWDIPDFLNDYIDKNQLGMDLANGSDAYAVTSSGRIFYVE